MTKQEYMDQSNENLLRVYNRFPVVFDHGDGVYLYDTDGKQYLDAASGIGVMALGYNDPEYTKTVQEQVGKLLHTSNLYYTPQLAKAAKAVAEAAGMDKVFFTNSGAEAIEGALKTAKKHAYLKNPNGRQEIIAMEHSFHGRTVGALSVTGTEHYREPFYPLMDGVRYATFNDLESVKKQMGPDVCAVIMETVQGEGGLTPATEEFIKGVRKLCDENGALLILDEIQCGLGRTGKMYAFEHYGVKPDIMTTAKALGLGVPVGAFAVTEAVAESSLVPGDHGTTYGGNPLVCAAVAASLSMLKERKIPEHVTEMTPYFYEMLERFVEKYDFVLARRGMGFMSGLQITLPLGEVLNKALEEGLIVLSAGSDVLRLLPPLVYTKENFDELEEKLTKVFDSFL